LESKDSSVAPFVRRSAGGNYDRPGTGGFSRSSGGFRGRRKKSGSIKLVFVLCALALGLFYGVSEIISSEDETTGDDVGSFFSDWSMPSIGFPSFSFMGLGSSQGNDYFALRAPKITSDLLPALEVPDVHTVRYKVKRGDTFGTICQNLGFGTEVANDLVAALEKKREDGIPQTIRVGQRLEFAIEESGSLGSLSYLLAPGKSLLIERKDQGEFAVRVNELPQRESERIALGVIDSSFAAAATKAGLDYDAIDELVDLFSNRVSFHRDIQKGDRFTIIYRARELIDGTPLGETEILAASLQIGGQSLSAIRYVGTDGKGRYFTEEGNLLGNSFLRYPLKFSRISSHFNRSRFHPVLKRRRAHNGVDFAARTGTPVRSVADGKVIFAGRKGGNGIMVKIRHTDRYTTAYLHLSKLAKGMRRGRKVARGEWIGNVGMTGLATGPHLHYSFYDRGRYVDPLKIKLPTVERLTSGTRIGAQYLKRVRFTLNHYQSVVLDDFYRGASEKDSATN
jgi:murein DD-endopeptidase MepM/ murein hydrolase activator NlpD